MIFSLLLIKILVLLGIDSYIKNESMNLEKLINHIGINIVLL